MFFFEKKNQKTFANRGLPPWCWEVSLPDGMDKSFLLLFFKKEVLPYAAETGARRHYMSDWSRADEEWELKMDQMRADIRLKNRQESLELPRFVVASLIAVATVAGAVGALFGWSLRGSGH